MLTTYARHVGFHPVNLLRTTRSRNLSHLFTVRQWCNRAIELIACRGGAALFSHWSLGCRTPSSRR